MSCDVGVLPFQAHANYETWLIDFVNMYKVVFYTYHINLHHCERINKKKKIARKEIYSYYWFLEKNVFLGAHNVNFLYHSMYIIIGTFSVPYYIIIGTFSVPYYIIIGTFSVPYYTTIGTFSVPYYTTICTFFVLYFKG